MFGRSLGGRPLSGRSIGEQAGAVRYFGGSAGAALNYATLDGVASNTTVTAGLTADHDNTTVGGARSATQKSDGKWYFEVTMTLWDAGADCCGVLTQAGTYTNLVTNGTNCATVYQTGAIWSNGANSTKTLGLRADGNIIGIAVDLDNDKVWFRVAPTGNWNGEVIGSQDPANNVGGVSISNFSATTMSPAIGFQSAATSQATANFGASSFSGAVPSGFTSGWTA